VLGILTVFLAPGFSLVCIALPERQSSIERLLASVAVSVTMATCAAVLLAATPVGLSRDSLGVLLGGFTIVLSVGGLYRTPSTTAQQESGGPVSTADRGTAWPQVCRVAVTSAGTTKRFDGTRKGRHRGGRS
jgi:uncharacterized membrane protein